MSCLLRLPKPLPSNFKALFSSRNRLLAVNDITVLLAGRCHEEHKNANHLRVHAGRWHAGRSLILAVPKHIPILPTLFFFLGATLRL